MYKKAQYLSVSRLRLILVWLQELLPGLLVTLAIGLSSVFIAEHYGGPALLYALLFGMACHFLSEDSKCLPGIEFGSRAILRLGVALLGARITLEQIGELGFTTLLITMTAVIATIILGRFAARLLGLRADFGVLTGSAVAICGASAALAVSAVLPKHENSERDTLLTVVGVTGLSTTAMIVYPILAMMLGLSSEKIGVFLGGTIHDVVQVVGAGYMISPLTGDTATMVKLLRVTLLVPVVIVIAWLFRNGPPSQNNFFNEKRNFAIPGFLLGFIFLVSVNSLGFVPLFVGNLMSDTSRGCMVLAISALGLKTSLKKLAMVGWKPIVLLLGETLFLAFLVLGLLFLG